MENPELDVSYDVPPLAASFEPVQLATPALVERFWPVVAPLLDRRPEAAHREFFIEDLWTQAMNQQTILFVMTNDPTGTHPSVEVPLAMAVSSYAYPRLPVVTILAIGGKDLGKYRRKFWNYFKGWAYMNGAKAIEAAVDPGMQRMLSSWDFEPVCTQMRCYLPENPDE